MPSTWLRHIVVLCMAAAATLAAPPMTVIQDVMYKANGTLFEGVAQISWNAFVASDGTPVPQNTINIRVVRGQLRVSLIPTTSATSTVTYLVRFNSEGKTQFTEQWSVPPSQTPLKLNVVRVMTGGAGNLTNNFVIQDVTGLRTELDLRPARGTTWTANRAAVIGGSGTLEAVMGDDTDCVRVDGTSAPCGTSLIYIDGEIPSGTANGFNTNFTLSAAPNPTQSLKLFRNGVLLSAADYTLTGTSVVFANGRIPGPGDILQAWYRTSGASPSIVEGEIPAGTMDGLNLTFTLQNAPVPAASLQVFRNGLLQKQGIDYYVATKTITFLPTSVPGPGDLVQANYRK